MKKMDFGYTISKDRQLDFDASDRRLSAFLSAAEPSFNICIGCGSCAATCSASPYTGLRLRYLMLMARRGQINSIKKELEACMLCGKCTLVCPRGVNTRNVILKMKKYFEDK